MRTTEHGSRRHDGFRSGVVVLTILCAAAPLLHAETAAMIPSTTAHYFSSRPMIAGTVLTINDHQMVVDTEQGERITLEVDSRTMAPHDLAPGMTVRTEFAALENCRFRAERVVPVRAGVSSQRLQAYANTRESRERFASGGSANRHAAMRRLSRGPQFATAANETRRPGEPSRGTIMRAMPGTADHHYSSRPLISGTVLSVNDHRVVVRTDQGRKVAMVMDSRTMVPREIAPGNLLRAEFREMQDGRYYAQRIHLIGSGAYREQAYANTADHDVVSAGIIGDCESVVPTPGNAATSAVAVYQPDRDGDRSADHNAAADHNAPADRNAATDHDASAAPDDGRVPARDENSRATMLPQTASRRPWFLLLGLLALGSAGVVKFVRLRTTG